VIDQIIVLLEGFSQKVPLEIFCLLGSFIEEIIGAIPSPVILVTSGSIVAHRHQTWLYLLLLAAIASAGKTFASWVIYIIFDKVEDVFSSKYGKYFGITHANIEKIGAYFSGGWRDDLIIFLFRAIPIFPTTTVAIACGFLKLDQKSFIRATYAGFFIRCLFLLYLGYAGIESFGFIKSWLTE
jgi:membrane protein DedA with SNARE-associated domain